MLGFIRKSITSSPFYGVPKLFLQAPPWTGSRPTLRRRVNLTLCRLEHFFRRQRLWSYPIKLTLEATNICNLRCPACFTGVGETGRQRSHMSLELYRALLDELGPYLWEVEFYNWGEPLLAKHIHTMITEASLRGLSTTVSTNFSIPFDAEKAEALVRSGLTVLGVSIDGARQASYEQYRVRGNLETVLHNCRLVRDAKQHLGATTPRMIWEYHVFRHNAEEVALARSMADELGMEIAVDKGWTVGAEWDPDGPWQFADRPQPSPCSFLWSFAVVNNDGGVAPCCGSFYREDDMGRLALTPAELGAQRFRTVWNSERFQTARGFYRSRTGPPAAQRQICFDCPNTVLWEDYGRHRAAGGTRKTFPITYSNNDVVNFFWNRRPKRPARREPGVGGRTAPDRAPDPADTPSHPPRAIVG